MHEQRREEARAAQVCLPGRQVTCKSTAWPWVQSRVWRNYMQSEHLCEQAGNATHFGMRLRKAMLPHNCAW